MKKISFSEKEIEKLKNFLKYAQEEQKQEKLNEIVDKEVLNIIRETLVTWIVENDLKKAITDLHSNELFIQTMVGYNDWKEYHKGEFKKAVKGLKHIFRQYNTIVPTDWEKIFYEWYLLKYPEFENASISTIPPLSEKQIFQWAKEHATQFEFISEEQSEKLKNLPHKLCVLEDLGFLKLLEERFSNKSYFGKASHNDKARLLASLFEIENPEAVRQALKQKQNGKNDFQSTKAIENANITLKNHGLEPSIFISINLF
ncbi:hypothetical protein [Rhodonellum sp.]|uniref:hypothetical protein n=1 Tax=Rhodonellum sp. TaxID=2231180 RepID=UPI0027226C04|nr:hypothetical protein [Rhodonellum sp.]MDO9553729.1 hypothetical protein [Rhodonellum sp.]